MVLKHNIWYSIHCFPFFSNRVAVVEEKSFTVTKDTVKNSNEKTLTKSDLLKKSNEIKEDIVTEKLNDSLSDFEAIPTDEFTRIDEVKEKYLLIIGTFKEKDNALTLHDQMFKKGYENCQIIYDGGVFYWVVFGIYRELSLAKKDNDKFKLEGWIKKM